MDFKKWDEQYHQEKKEWTNLVKDFINTANGNEDAYKKIENYEFLRQFNFDILNMRNLISEKYLNILSFKTNISISHLINMLTNKRTIYKGDSSDPDNMDIVRAILFVIFDENKLKMIYDNFQKKSDEKIGKVENSLSEIQIKKDKIEETIDLYRRIDNIYMLRPDTTNSYNTMAVNKYENVFSTEYLDFFKTNELDEIQCLERDFYYDYHTISNFCLLPNETLEIHLQRYIEWMNSLKESNKKRIKQSDSINQYRGKNLLLNASKFGKDNFYSYLFILKNIWDCLVTEDNNGMIRAMKDIEGIGNSDSIAQLFSNNNFFYKVFENFDEYCAEMMIDYSMYRNREFSELESKKAYFSYNKLIIDYRWNHIKNKLFYALNEI